MGFLARSHGHANAGWHPRRAIVGCPTFVCSCGAASMITAVTWLGIAIAKLEFDK